MSISHLFSRSSIVTKLISILIINSFIFSGTSFGLPKDEIPAPMLQEKITDPAKIVIPREAGLVKSKFTGNSGKLIIHIQDAHCNYEAQANIVKVIENLIKNQNLKLISVEGADGPIDTSWFKAFPDDEVRKEVATYFMKKGEITGPEFISITTDYPIKLFGAETRSYYIQNLNAFTSSYSSKEETEKHYNQIKTVIEKLKKYIYSEELKDLDVKMAEYESKKLQFNDYVRYLQTLAEKHKINLKTYDNLYKLINVLVYESKIDFNQTDKERSTLIDELSKKLSKDVLTELVAQSIAFKMGKISSAEYYNYLKDIALKNSVDMAKGFPNLYNYIIYNSVYSKIENDKLFHDIKLVETAIKEKLFQNEDQRTLEKLSRHIDTLLGLINIKLLNGDFDYYKTHKEEYSHEAFTDFIKKKTIQYGLAYEIDPPNEAVVNSTAKLEDFYSIAIKRDKALVDNTLEAMSKDKQEIAVLVTGGFHSEGITKLLEKQGVSYLVICPSITKDVPNPYIQILTNQRTPLEDILVNAPEAKDVKQTFVAPYLISAATELDEGTLNEVSNRIEAYKGRKLSNRAWDFVEDWSKTYISRWISKAERFAGRKSLPKDKEILLQAFKLGIDNAISERQLSGRQRARVYKLAEMAFDRIYEARQPALGEGRAATAGNGEVTTAVAVRPDMLAATKKAPNANNLLPAEQAAIEAEIARIEAVGKDKEGGYTDFGPEKEAISKVVEIIAQNAAYQGLATELAKPTGSKVVVRVLDRGDRGGFERADTNIDREIYCYSKKVGDTLYIYTTKVYAFLANPYYNIELEASAEGRATIEQARARFAQSLAHEYAEQILGKTHAEATKDEMTFASVEARRAGVSDSNLFILDKAAEDGGITYLLNILKNYVPAKDPAISGLLSLQQIKDATDATDLKTKLRQEAVNAGYNDLVASIDSINVTAGMTKEEYIAALTNLVTRPLAMVNGYLGLKPVKKAKKAADVQAKLVAAATEAGQPDLAAAISAIPITEAMKKDKNLFVETVQVLVSRQSDRLGSYQPFRTAAINALGKLLALHLIKSDVDRLSADHALAIQLFRLDTAVISDAVLASPDVRSGIVQAISRANEIIDQSVQRSLVGREIDKEQDLRGEASTCFTAEVAYRIAKAYGTVLRAANPNGKDLTKERLVVVMGKDPRLSNARIRAAEMRGLNEVGIDTIDIAPDRQVTTTPMIGFAISSCDGLKARRVDGGVQNTASHLEGTYAGVKLYIGDQSISDQLLGGGRERRPEAVLSRAEHNTPADYYTMQAGQQVGTNSVYGNLVSDYVAYTAKCMRDMLGPRGLEALQRKKFVIDPGNGTGNAFIQVLLTLGVPAENIRGLYADPNGYFPNHLSDPNKPWLYEELVNNVRSFGADLGVSFDSDSDRVGFVSNNGNHISGHDLLMFLADRILKKAPYRGSTIVFNNRTTQAMEEVIARNGGVAVRAPTGYTKIIAEINNQRQAGKVVGFGGEESKHIMFPENNYRDDGIFSAAMFLAMMAEETQGIDEILGEFPHYSTDWVSKQVLGSDDPAQCRELKREIEAGVLQKLQQMRDEWKITRGILTNDGIWVYMDDLQGWALIRGSLSETKIFGVDVEVQDAKDKVEMYCRVHQLLQPYVEEGKISLESLEDRIREKVGGFTELAGFVEDNLIPSAAEAAFKIIESTNMSRAKQQEELIDIMKRSLKGEALQSGLKACKESYDIYMAQKDATANFLARNVYGRNLADSLMICESFTKARLAQQNLIDPRPIIGFTQGTRIVKELLDLPTADEAQIHLIAKKIFASMRDLAEPGLQLQESDNAVNPLIVAVRMKAVRMAIGQALRDADEVTREKIYLFSSSTINQYIAFVKLTGRSIAIRREERALIDREIEFARGFAEPIRENREKVKVVAAINKLFPGANIDPNAETANTAITNLLLNKDQGTLRNMIERVIGVDIIAAQRLGKTVPDAEKERALALRFMKAVCVKMATLLESPLEEYTKDAAGFKRFQEVFNKHFGVIFVVMAGGSGSRYGYITHKSQGQTFLGMSNVDLALRGAFRTPSVPEEGQDSHYLISSLFTYLQHLAGPARLGIMAQDEEAVKADNDKWPKQFGMTVVAGDEMDQARRERNLPAGTYYLRQEPGDFGYGGSFMAGVEFMIDQQRQGRCPDVPYFMRLDGEQCTLQEQEVANIALITWMTTVADDNLLTLGLREDKVIEGKGMPLDAPLLGSVRFLQDWRNIPPTIVRDKLLELLRDIPENAKLRAEIKEWLTKSDEEKGLLIEQVHGDTAIQQRNPMLINANIVVIHKKVAGDYFGSVPEHEQLKGQVNDRTGTAEFAPADVSVCIFDDYAINKPGQRIPVGYAVVEKGPSAIKNTFKQSEFNTYWQSHIREMLKNAGVDISELQVLTINPGPEVAVFNLQVAQQMLFGPGGVFTVAKGGKVAGVKLSGKVHIDLRSRIANGTTITNSYVLGHTEVGQGSSITGSTLLDIKVGERCVLENVYLKDGRTIPADSNLALSNTEPALGAHSRVDERPVLEGLYERSSIETETPSEQVAEVLAGKNYNPVESFLLAQNMDGEAILKFMKELREQEFGEEEDSIDIEAWKKLSKADQLQYVVRHVIKNMGLFTSLSSMDYPLEGQPLTFPIVANSVPITCKIAGLDTPTMELVFKIIYMFGKTEFDNKNNRNMRKVDAVHIMGPLTIENEFTRFGAGVTVDGLVTRGRLFAGDGWGIVNSRITNHDSVVVLGDHLMILDSDEDVTPYEPPLDGDINSLTVLKDCTVTAGRTYIGAGAGTWDARYRGKVIQGATFVGDVVIIPEGRNPVRMPDGRITGIDKIERGLAEVLSGDKIGNTYPVLRDILRGDANVLETNRLTREGRITSLATALCLIVQAGKKSRVNKLLEQLELDEGLEKEAPELYTALMNRLFIISQIVEPISVYEDWFKKSGRSPVEAPRDKLASLNDIRKRARDLEPQFRQVFDAVAACRREGIEPAMMTTERRLVSVEGKERLQRGFASEMTPLDYYKTPQALGVAILRHSVIKDPEDLRLTLQGYLEYTRMQKAEVANNGEAAKGYRKALDAIEQAMSQRWEMPVTDDTVVSIYVATFGPENYIGIPTDRPFEFSCFRGGRGAHWFLNEIKDQLRAMGVTDLKMDMLPGATDDGRSWLLSSLIFDAPGMPDIGKCLLDIAKDRTLADIIGKDSSRFNSIEQLELFNETYKAAKAGAIKDHVLPSGKSASQPAELLYEYGHGKDATEENGKAADTMAEYVEAFYKKLQSQRTEMDAVEAQNVTIHTLTELRDGLLSQKEPYPEHKFQEFITGIWNYMTEPATGPGEHGRKYKAIFANVQGEIESMIGKRDENGKLAVHESGENKGKPVQIGCLLDGLKKDEEKRKPAEILEEELFNILQVIRQKDPQALREFLYAEFCANMTISKFGTPIRSAVLVGAHLYHENELKGVAIDDLRPEEQAVIRDQGANNSDVAWQRAIDSVSGFLRTQGSVNPATLRRYHLSGVAQGKIDKRTGKPTLQLLLSEDSYNEIPKEGEFLFTRLMRKPILDPAVKKRLRQAAKEGNLQEVISIFNRAHEDASAARGESAGIVLNPKCVESIKKTRLLFLFPTTLMSNIGPAILDERIGQMVAGNDEALKIYIHNALRENDPPDTTAATMLENLYRMLSHQHRWDTPEARWADVNKYFTYAILRNPCLYAAYAKTYIAPDKNGIERRVGDRVSTVELDLEDPKSNSKGRYLGPPLMRSVLQLEQMRNIGMHIQNGRIQRAPNAVEADVSELQRHVRTDWDMRQLNAAGETSQGEQAPTITPRQITEMIVKGGNPVAAAQTLFTVTDHPSLMRDIIVAVNNNILSQIAISRDANVMALLRQFNEEVIRQSARFGIEHSQFARDITLISGQTITILSWIAAGVPGAEGIGLTTNPDRALKSSKGISFLDIDTLPKMFTGHKGVSFTEQEGTPGIFWRGIEGLEKMGSNVFPQAMRNQAQFDAEKNNVVLYLMDHGFIEVPSQMRPATQKKEISTIHETAFLTNLIPGSSQCASTGAGHFQGLSMDLKYVTEGNGIQWNKFYNDRGELVAVFAQHLKPGTWAVALPGAVDTVENLGGLKFNDVSVALTQKQATDMVQAIAGSKVDFEAMDTDTGKRVLGLASSQVPYYVVNVNGENSVVKNIDTAPEINWTNGIPASVFGNLPLTRLYQQLTVECKNEIVQGVQKLTTSPGWATAESEFGVPVPPAEIPQANAANVTCGDMDQEDHDVVEAGLKAQLEHFYNEIGAQGRALNEEEADKLVVAYYHATHGVAISTAQLANYRKALRGAGISPNIPVFFTLPSNGNMLFAVNGRVAAAHLTTHEHPITDALGERHSRRIQVSLPFLLKNGIETPENVSRAIGVHELGHLRFGHHNDNDYAMQLIRAVAAKQAMEYSKALAESERPITFAMPNIRIGKHKFTWGEFARYSKILKLLGVGPADIHVERDEPIAEYWIASDDETYPSMVDLGNGQFMSLRDFLNEHAATVLGAGHFATYGPYMGCVMKYIDARDTLSVQIHPTEGHPNRPPKPEFWKVLSDGSQMYFGLNQDVTPAQLARAVPRPNVDAQKVLDKIKANKALQGRVIDNLQRLHEPTCVIDGLTSEEQRNLIKFLDEHGQLEELMNLERYAKGDLISVPGGVLHAIHGRGKIAVNTVTNESASTFIAEWSQAPSRREAEMGVDLMKATVGLYDRDKTIGKRARPNKEDPRGTIEVMQDAVSRGTFPGAFKRLNPNSYRMRPVSIYRDALGNEAFRLFESPFIIVEEVHVMPQAVLTMSDVSGRGYPICIEEGTVEIRNAKGEKVCELSRGQGALIPATISESITIVATKGPAVVQRWFAPLPSEKQAIERDKAATRTAAVTTRFSNPMEDRVRAKAFELSKIAGRNATPTDNWLEAERIVKGIGQPKAEGRGATAGNGEAGVGPAAGKPIIETVDNATAEYLKTTANKVAIDGLQATLESVAQSRLLAADGTHRDGVIILAYDTGIGGEEAREATTVNQLCHQMTDNSIGPNRVIRVKGTGAALTAAVDAAQRKYAGKVLASVIVASNETMGTQEESLKKLGRILQIQSQNPRLGKDYYIPVPGLYDLALRVAIAEILHKTTGAHGEEYTPEGLEFIMQRLNNVALNSDGTPFTKDDIQGLLRNGLIRMLPRITPVNMVAAHEAYKAAQSTLRSL